MAKFCTRCGKPLQEGEICSCSANSTPMPKIDTTSAKGFLESMKNRMGIGDPELNKDDAFEKGKQIIPDCVRSNESEIPVKQYTVATLRNRIFGIPFVKAIGRIQVTNKRVIFRAPGRSLVGRTTLQQEFAVDEIAGIEARREYVFAFWALIFGMAVMELGGMVMLMLLQAMTGLRGAGAIILSLLFGIAGCIPFFTLKKKWLLKLLCLGGSFMSLAAIGNGFFYVLAFISLAFAIFALVIYTFRPNLVLLVKTKGASDAIDIRRYKKPGIFARLFGNRNEKDNHTGFTEILPLDDTERCIREIDAMINDIQKLGDFGIEKWKS